MFGSADSEHPRLTNGEIISEESNLCDHNPPTSQTDGRIDRQTTCDRKTALCTKVHRTAKTLSLVVFMKPLILNYLLRFYIISAMAYKHYSLHQQITIII